MVSVGAPDQRRVFFGGISELDRTVILSNVAGERRSERPSQSLLVRPYLTIRMPFQQLALSLLLVPAGRRC